MKYHLHLFYLHQETSPTDVSDAPPSRDTSMIYHYLVEEIRGMDYLN